MGCVSSSDGLIIQFEGRPLCTDDIVGCSSSGWLSARSTVHRTLMIGSMSVGADDLHLEPQTALGIASSCTRLLCLEDDPSVPGCRHAHLPCGGPAQLRRVPRPDLDLKARIGHRIASPNQHCDKHGCSRRGRHAACGGRRGGEKHAMYGQSQSQVKKTSVTAVDFAKPTRGQQHGDGSRLVLPGVDDQRCHLLALVTLFGVGHNRRTIGMQVPPQQYTTTVWTVLYCPRAMINAADFYLFLAKLLCGG